ncbi:hypothetical protein AAC387_Pa01g2120 [Persea americana]
MNVVTILIGNKTDLKDGREVSADEGKTLAEAQHLFFLNIRNRIQHGWRMARSLCYRKMPGNQIDSQKKVDAVLHKCTN